MNHASSGRLEHSASPNSFSIQLFVGVILAALAVLTGCAKKPGPDQAPQPPKEPAMTKESIKVSIPAGQKFVTVVVDDAQGVRVRNLHSWQPVEKFGGNPASGQPQTLIVSWDGKDDDGKEVPPGRYTVRGLSHKGLDALFERSYYNPGNPPWHGYPNSHWAANHGDPLTIALVPKDAATDWEAVVGCNMSEGTDCLFAIGKDGLKKWGFYQAWGSANNVAVQGETLYFTLGPAVRAINVKDGKPGVFRRPAGSLPQVSFGATFEKGYDSMAVNSNTIALLSTRFDKNPQNMLILLDRETGRTNSEFFALDTTGKLAFAPDNRLFLSTTNGLFTLDPATGTKTPVPLPEVAQPGAVRFDRNGNLYVQDKGPDQQIKVFTPDLKPLKTFGIKGGQKFPAYNPDAFHNLLDFDVDGEGNLWTTEGAHPRRQAKWAPDGKRIKEFVGSTPYGAWNSASLHSHDPKRAFVWNVEIETDPAQVQSYSVKKFVSSPFKQGSKINPEMYNPFSWFFRNHYFRSAASGQPREYMLYTGGGYPILFLEKNGDYRPVAAVWSKNSHHAFLSPWSRPSDPDGTPYVWTDLNEDEDIQENEVVVLAGSRGGGVSWTAPMNEQLEFYTGGQSIKPVRFLPSGAPVYDKSGVAKLELKGHDKVIDTLKNDPNNRQKPEQYYLRIGNHLYASYGDWPYFFTGKHVWTDLKGNVVATRKVHGSAVHGSMAIGMVPPGEMTGELFVAGSAKVNDEVGHVMAIHGNYGQVYFLTEDGVFVSPIFKDSRNNPEGWGEKAERGKSWNNISMYQEAFCGWFGRHDDGKFRYSMGHTSANVLEITGLDTLKTFRAGQVEIPAKPGAP